MDGWGWWLAGTALAGTTVSAVKSGLGCNPTVIPGELADPRYLPRPTYLPSRPPDQTYPITSISSRADNVAGPNLPTTMPAA